MWASAKGKRKMPTLDRYLIKADDGATTAEAKARRNLAAVRLLSEQFGIPIRRGSAK